MSNTFMPGERLLRSLREQDFERYRLWDRSSLVYVAHERLELVPIALKPELDRVRC